MNYLGYEVEKLSACSGEWTAREIWQQPAAWKKTAVIVESELQNLQEWFDEVLRQPDLQIILTGAGTSAYIGQTLAPYLQNRLGMSVKAVATTDIVSNPDQYLLKDKPTLVVSYGRSGNSPESVAACALVSQVVTNCFHLIISCNKESTLSGFARNTNNSQLVVLPPETLDQSFAMTSSFTSMIVATLCLFTPDTKHLDAACEASAMLMGSVLDDIKETSLLPYERLTYLGSGSLNGMAFEAALKMQELSAGQLDCYAYSSLGFRHGPKSLVNDKTLIIMLTSLNDHTRQYDKDLLNELLRDNQALKIVDLSSLPGLQKLENSDIWLALPYIVYCQILAFYRSISLGISPDNPCPTGEVNRVVQGVTIYPFE